MFLQDAIPDTSGYMILGYAIFFVIVAVYIVSYFVRSRNLERDLSLLESMESEAKAIKNKEALVKVAAGKPAKDKKPRSKAPASKTRKKK